MDGRSSMGARPVRSEPRALSYLVRLVTGLVASLIFGAGAGEPPVPTGAVEQVKVRLVQLDAEIVQPEGSTQPVTAADLELEVGGVAIGNFVLDRACAETPAEPAPEGTPRTEAPPAPAPVTHTTLVLFFDQSHLTMAGREGAIKIARSLIDRLIRNGARASIVSSASSLQTVVPMTDDPAKLLAGLDAMRRDPKAFDSYAMTEGSRVDDVLRQPDMTAKRSLVRWYAREERSQVGRTKDRVVGVLSGLADVSPPKGLVLFSDTLRQKAGLHFYHLLCPQTPVAIRPSCPEDPDVGSEELMPAAAMEIDEMVRTAVDRGVHFFTIEGQGMTATVLPSETERIALGEDTLVGLAAETGGEAFIRNGDGARMAERIAARVACPYIVSFSPGDLPRDKPLAVSLKAKAPGTKVKVQGRVVILSDSALLQARLTGAFAEPGLEDDGTLHAALIPRAFDGQTWKATLQVWMLSDDSGSFGATLGASTLQGDRVVDEISSSIATEARAAPIVLEHRVSLTPGKTRVVAVAHGRDGGDVYSTSLETEFPKVGKGAPVIAPVAVVQSRPAAVAEDKGARATGSTAIGEGEAIDPSRPVTLLSVVCRGADRETPLVIERWLEGKASSDYAPMTLEPGGEACLVTSDVVAAHGVENLLADYRIVVRSKGEIVADQRRALHFGAAPRGSGGR